jgi:hypothetical protein
MRIQSITITKTPWGRPLAGNVTFSDGREGRWFIRAHHPEITLRGKYGDWRRVNSPKREAAVSMALAQAESAN